jgi:outer membrane protein OmpA-like peptidoglycan-associated protein
MKLPSRLAALALCAALATGAVHALAQEKVWREGQVTQQGLIDALAPAPAASAADDEGEQPRTRSFRPAVRPGVAAAGTAAAAVPPARASILVTFVTDSAELTKRAMGALDVLAAAMKSEQLASVHFTIEGHADPRGGEDHNLKLSQARAESVRRYLMNAHALKAERIVALGRGSSALMNPGEPAAPENRRVTIIAQP